MYDRVANLFCETSNPSPNRSRVNPIPVTMRLPEMSLYRAYFVPNDTDPEGTFARVNDESISFCVKQYIKSAGATGLGFAGAGGTGLFCFARQVLRMKRTQGTDWKHDKYGHCMFSCLASRKCGRTTAWVGGGNERIFRLPSSKLEWFVC